MSINDSSLLQDSLFLKACRKEELPRPPVWMMRQAGRYLPEYRQTRSKHDFLTMCRTPELASEVTVQPVNILGVDAAVIFSDILVVLEAMGLPIRFENGGGPRIDRPIRSAKEVEHLTTDQIVSRLSYVGEAIRLTVEKLKGRAVPVIGFAGAPFTLAAYAVEGKTSREFLQTKRLMNREPKVFELLLDQITTAVTDHLLAQIQAGAAVVQLFDTWAGLLSQGQYREMVLPKLQRVVRTVQEKGKVPVAIYVNGSTPHLKSLVDSGADVLSVDWRLSLSEVRRQVGEKVVLQGNLDPTRLYASPQEVRRLTEEMLRDHPQPGLIANLGHGMLPDIPMESVRTFVETVKNFR